MSSPKYLLRLLDGKILEFTDHKEAYQERKLKGGALYVRDFIHFNKLLVDENHVDENVASLIKRMVNEIKGGDEKKIIFCSEYSTISSRYFVWLEDAQVLRDVCGLEQTTSKVGVTRVEVEIGDINSVCEKLVGAGYNPVLVTPVLVNGVVTDYTSNEWKNKE